VQAARYKHPRVDAAMYVCRGFISEEQDPVLHASSYETDNALLRMRPELADEPQRRLIKKGYKAQCSTVLSQVMTLVNLWHSSCASVIVEGVHLHLKQVMQMMAKHPSILPFLVRFLCWHADLL
jgi:2-phosphoglycerate kinase